MSEDMPALRRRDDCSRVAADYGRLRPRDDGPKDGTGKADEEADTGLPA